MHRSARMPTSEAKSTGATEQVNERWIDEQVSGLEQLRLGQVPIQGDISQSAFDRIHKQQIEAEEGSRHSS